MSISHYWTEKMPKGISSQILIGVFSTTIINMDEPESKNNGLYLVPSTSSLVFDYERTH